MPAAGYLLLERNIAHAHKALWSAMNQADNIGLPTLALDLQQLSMEVARLQEDMLRGRDLRRTRDIRRVPS